jgi:hypothetical protein
LDECTEHQLQDLSLAKGVGDDLEAVALFDEEPLKQVRGANRPAVRHGEAEVCNAGFEVVHEASHTPFLIMAEVCNDAGGKLTGNGAVRRTALVS